MLRVFEDAAVGGSRVLRLEGRVVGPWVDELRHAADHPSNGTVDLVVDLARVSYLDADGVALIRELAERGVRVVNSSPFVVEQLRTT